MWGAVALAQRSLVLAFVASSKTSMLRRSITSSTTALAAMQYLLKYDYIPDALEKRGPYGQDHLGLANQLVAEGKCLSGGPTGQPGVEVPTGALFIFTDEELAKAFVQGGMYVFNGIVTSHAIEEWNVVIQKE
jgi:uncharacterized protein YciI